MGKRRQAREKQQKPIRAEPRRGRRGERAAYHDQAQEPSTAKAPTPGSSIFYFYGRTVWAIGEAARTRWDPR